MKVNVGNNQEMAHTEVYILLYFGLVYLPLLGTGPHTANGMFLHDEKVQVGNDLENAQSERNSHSKNRGGKN